MKKTLFSIASFTLYVSAVVSSPAVYASGASHWGYSGHAGPQHWSELNDKYSVCASGKNQSPINLTRFVESDLEVINFDYKAGGGEVINNGHTTQVNFSSGSKITINEHTYGLKQFHVHSPSENTINGQHYPMEAHLVHADYYGNLAVVAIMFEEGESNPILAKAWENMPEHAGGSYQFSNKVSAEGILPSKRDYYRFNGSLTTPPCSEGVVWMVLKTPMTASKAQLKKFGDVMGFKNNRPIQPINARVINQ